MIDFQSLMVGAVLGLAAGAGAAMAGSAAYGLRSFVRTACRLRQGQSLEFHCQIGIDGPCDQDDDGGDDDQEPDPEDMTGRLLGIPTQAWEDN